MELVIVAIILTFNLALLWKLRTDDAFLKDYVQSSPKAALWRWMFGKERAASVIRNVLVPLGIGIWIALLIGIPAASWLFPEATH